MFKISFKKTKKKIFLIAGGIVILIILLAGGAIGGYFYFKQNQKNPAPLEQTSKDVYIEFLSEVYDKIQENYWNKISDEELSNLFKLGAEKLIQAPQNLESPDKQGVNKMASEIIKNMDEEKKKAFSAQLAHLVLWNLKPFGKSALYVKQDEENLQNRVENINLETGEVEPTVFGNLVTSNILHLYISKISPTTVDDLKKETEKFDNTEGLNTLILDLRGNVGGSLDILPYLLGPFIGPNRYAFEIFQQGNYDPLKTKFGWLPGLVRYKKVVILADGNTQSSAEVMVATLKEYNVGIFVGTKTKGWGTIEKVYEIDHQIDADEKYSIFLVNHLTLRDGNQPIEEAGVDPTIDINEPGWEDKLFEYFNSNELIKTVKEVWNSPPGKI